MLVFFTCDNCNRWKNITGTDAKSKIARLYTYNQPENFVDQNNLLAKA